MLLKSLVIPKKSLTIVKESSTLQEAIEILETSGFRCVPVLDETETIFRGNIYKMHIYRHKANGGDMSLPVTHLIKNSTKFISIDSSFFNVFFTIKELPYIAVLDKQEKFYGILTHSSLLNMLEQSWSVDTGAYVLTVLSGGEKGSLVNLTKIISKFSPIASLMTLDVRDEESVKRILVTLPANVTRDLMEQIVVALNKKDFSVVGIEDLKKLN
ncbi:cyclic di-AMP binding protein CbpA [Granulicatella seriolae]|uniref:Cyclic di-AMP binding protein CbpA n=1 Tax=Granulicatella seriolae TaxID=2967226 RepID=A0ABT1WQD0_9LACT|nr:cyclic di-AMP binding protein CbpA [Granulicatella seriolae]